VPCGLADETAHSATRVRVHRIPATGARMALAAVGELLVAGAGRKSAALLLEGRGFTATGAVGPVLRLVRRNASMDEIRASCGALRELGVMAGPNYVTAVAPVKGMSGLAAPRPTSRCPKSADRGQPRCGRASSCDRFRHSTQRRFRRHAAGSTVSASTARRQATGICWTRFRRLTASWDEVAGHGTFVAGIRQTAPACEILAIKALDSDDIGPISPSLTPFSSLRGLTKHPSW
jgi:hypothetical protein